jgi:hypothetical protein
MNYTKQSINQCNFNKWLILLYVYYFSQNLHEEIKYQYDDFITDTAAEDAEEEEEDDADEFNLSIYAHEDSSNYLQVLTKTIFCLFH